MVEAEVSVAWEARTDLGESPVWDELTQTLYFVDINSKQVLVYRPGHDDHFRILLDEPCATVLPTTHQHLILVPTRWNVLKVDVKGRRITGTVASIPKEHEHEGYRFNDGKVSPQGWVLLGRMSNKWREGERGRVYCLAPGSDSLEEVMKPEEVHLPNGMAWDESRNVVYFIDSGAESVVAYKADDNGMPTRSTEGKLLGERLVHVPSNLKHVPDGMTLDSDGRLWVAIAESGCVACFDPDSGAELRRIHLPCQRPTACTFGGLTLDTLYVTTREETSPEPSIHAGALLQIKIPGVRGLHAAYRYPI